MANNFDPWDSSLDLETVLTFQRKWEAEGNRLEDPCGPLYQAVNARYVESLRSSIDKGDGFSVLAAIRICLNHGLVGPEWLSYAFNRRYDQVLNCRAGSWDDPKAFGKPYKKGAHLNALRKKREKCFAVLNDINEIRAREPSTPIDKALFERVGKRLGLGGTLTEEYYYHAKNIVDITIGYRNTGKSR